MKNSKHSWSTFVVLSGFVASCSGGDFDQIDDIPDTLTGDLAELPLDDIPVDLLEEVADLPEIPDSEIDDTIVPDVDEVDIPDDAGEQDDAELAEDAELQEILDDAEVTEDTELSDDAEASDDAETPDDAETAEDGEIQEDVEVGDDAEVDEDADIDVDPTLCTAIDDPLCDDGILCTIDVCDVETGLCEHTTDDALCTNGLVCDGEEICTITGCLSGFPLVCDDEDACTTNVCDDVLGCVFPIRDADGDNSGDLACGGTDCDDTNTTINPAATEVCNTADDNCDGNIDEGVTSTCGDCDPTCVLSVVTEGSGFDAAGEATSVAWDDEAGGVALSTTTIISSYLWVPNTAESTLSRWDTQLTTELSRYRVGLPAGECPGACCWSGGCNMPSRVAIDAFGDAYVANRGFSMQGTVVKVAADIDDCVDRNDNGMIDTAIGSTPLPWGEDECVLWTANVGAVNAVLRVLAIDRGDENRPEGYVWAGGYESRKFYKLDPRTGETLLEVDVPETPYVGIVASDGKLWYSTLDHGNMGSVDTLTGEPGPVISYATRTPSRGGCALTYGITADAAGRLWLAGWSCADVVGYDPASDTFTRLNFASSGSWVGRGITVDQFGQIWAALGGEGQSRLAVFDSNAFAADAEMTVTPTIYDMPAGHTGPSGVGVDLDGNIWLAHYLTSQLVRFQPLTESIDSFAGPNQVYTYSDFTGSVRRLVIGVGYYSRNFDAGCDNPIWDQLSWSSTTPTGTRLSFLARTANTDSELDLATAIPLAVAPEDGSDVNIGATFASEGVTTGRHLGLTIGFDANALSESPVLHEFSLRWYCPR